MSFLIQNFQVWLRIIARNWEIYFKKSRKFNLFLTWEGACIQPQIWPRKIPDAAFHPVLH